MAGRDCRAVLSPKGESRTEALRDVRRILDRLLAEYPDSAVAMRLRSEAPFFSKVEMDVVNGKLSRKGLARAGYANSNDLNEVSRAALVRVQPPQYTPYTFRKTLSRHGDRLFQTREHFYAWAMNLGREHLATTSDSYIPVS